MASSSFFHDSSKGLGTLRLQDRSKFAEINSCVSKFVRTDSDRWF